MKYIMFQGTHEGKPTLLFPVIFPDILNHSDVAVAIQEGVKVMPEGPFSRWWMWPKPVSAGFFCHGICTGYSESLNLKSNPADTAIVKSYMETGHYVTETEVPG